MSATQVGILKSLWSRRSDGRWAVTDIKGLYLNPRPGFALDYFAIADDFQLMTTSPSGGVHQLFASFGSTEWLLKQSIVPIVVWLNGDPSIRCIGTASVISCSGYLLTAAHVIMDLYEGGYADTKEGGQIKLREDLNFGVFIPVNPASGRRGVQFYPIGQFWLWGTWQESPLITASDTFAYLTDVAICKIPPRPEGVAHQPLNMSLNPFTPDEVAYALGYAEMPDVNLEYRDDGLAQADPTMDLYVSVGKVMRLYPQNHLLRDVPTPGPCFDFEAKIPGKMSGAPIFGAEGTVIRGVVSRSFSGERHAFGAMLGPAMDLPLEKATGTTFKAVMTAGLEGIPIIQGAGL